MQRAASVTWVSSTKATLRCWLVDWSRHFSSFWRGDRRKGLVVDWRICITHFARVHSLKNQKQRVGWSIVRKEFFFLVLHHLIDVIRVRVFIIDRKMGKNPKYGCLLTNALKGQANSTIVVTGISLWNNYQPVSINDDHFWMMCRLQNIRKFHIQHIFFRCIYSPNFADINSAKLVRTSGSKKGAKVKVTDAHQELEECYDFAWWKIEWVVSNQRYGEWTSAVFLKDSIGSSLL